jgi:hypothetical protein
MAPGKSRFGDYDRSPGRGTEKLRDNKLTAMRVFIDMSGHARPRFRLADRGLEESRTPGRARGVCAEQRQFRAPPLAAAATAAGIVAIEIAVGAYHMESSSWHRSALGSYEGRVNEAERNKHR